MFFEESEYLDLAMARYPDAEPGLAVMYYASDRRRARLGALDGERRRSKQPGPFTWEKDAEPQGTVLYRLRLSRDAMRVFDDFELPEIGALPMDATITTRDVPAVHKAINLRFHWSEFVRRAERRVVAVALWRARAQLRSPGVPQVP